MLCFALPCLVLRKMSQMLQAILIVEKGLTASHYLLIQTMLLLHFMLSKKKKKKLLNALAPLPALAHQRRK